MSNKKHTVEHNEKTKTVWINGEINCLGRFTPNGYEVFRKFDVENGGLNQTLEVTVKPLKPIDWDNFMTHMQVHHGIDLREEVKCPL